MAYSSLVSLEKTISQILDHGSYSISPHGRKQIISLDKYALSFKAFLEDFPAKAENLEARIMDAVMEAEDIIEWFMTEQIRHRIFRYTHWIAELRRVKFEFKLRKARDEMDSIAAEAAELKNSIVIGDAQLDDSVGASSSSPSSSSPEVADAGKIKMVGLNEDLIEIKARLCSCSPQLQILPIFGMGGIGKTTLARNAYDDPLIVEHFDIRAWVTVSQDYSERLILSDLLDSMKEFDPEWRNGSMAERGEHGNESLAEIPELSNGEMAQKVHKMLVRRRFLVVMDDIWSTEAFDYAKLMFPDNNNGSRVMLTTRLANVAAYADASTPFHEMRLMDVGESWNLLSAHQGHIPLELESIGKEIARSCGGLPLALVVVGGLLSTVGKTRASWEEIARNVKSSLATTGDGQIQRILSLSYNQLPRHLRPCFLYMGAFPEDHEIRTTDLVRLWIAEGFVKQTASKRSEDTAEEYLEDLINRSLVVVTKRKSNGGIKSCSLHDMVREMCIKLAREEKLLLHITGRHVQALSMKGQRRISVSRADLDSVALSSTLRTIMCFHNSPVSLGSLSLLRVLDVLRVRFRSRLLPDQFFELFHLRYLALCYYKPLPRAIANLRSLQTLIIKSSLYRPMLHEIWQLPQLRHLIISGYWVLTATATPTTPLHNLQTLGKLKNLTCSIRNLAMVPNLTKLKLTYFLYSGKLLFHNLVHLRRLEKLQLELETEWRSSGDPNLVVPSSLKKLTLIGWGHYKPYINFVGPFPNLEVLKLIKFNFKTRDWTVCDGVFPRLKFLLLDGSNLAEWDVASSGFPRLEKLLVRHCLGLRGIPYEIGEIPTLELIELILCQKALAASAGKMLEEQLSYGNDSFQVRCIDCRELRYFKKRRPVYSKSVTVREPKTYTTTWDYKKAKLKMADYRDAIWTIWY